MLMNKIKNTLTYGNLIPTLALFLALGGSALAVSTVAKTRSPRARSRRRGPRGSRRVRADRANSVGGTEVKDDSLTDADVQEATLAQVPSAAVGGTGRYGFVGSYNPDGPAFVSCASVNVDLTSPARLLVTATVRAHIEGGAAKFSIGRFA
jgi:hypothetical protein